MDPGLELTEKSCPVKKGEESELKNLLQEKIFLQSHSNFQLFQRAFCSGSIMFLEITWELN